MRTTRRTRSVILAAGVVAAFLVSSAQVGAVVKVGTPNGEVLTGTHGRDQLTGAGGNDTLRGLAGNDLYYFDDNYGTDTLEERASYTVGGKKVAGGVDTLSFLATNGNMAGRFIPQWGPHNNFANGGGGSVDLGTSPVENVILGGSSYDWFEGGPAKNTLQPGGGTTDWLYDLGGWVDGGDPSRNLPASNDVFKGFARNTGTDYVADWGGTDVVDLRPFSTEDVYIAAFSADGDDDTEESLQIVTSDTTQVVLVGHFGPYAYLTSDFGQQGRIETLIFADATLSGPSAAQALGAAAAEASSVEGGKQARLAEAAERLADQARRELKRAPEPGAPVKSTRSSDERRAADKGGAGERLAAADRGRRDEPRAGASRGRDERRDGHRER